MTRTKWIWVLVVVLILLLGLWWMWKNNVPQVEAPTGIKVATSTIATTTNAAGGVTGESSDFDQKGK